MLAEIAQLAEQLFCKQQVAGSSPTLGSRPAGILDRNQHGLTHAPAHTESGNSKATAAPR